MKVDLAQLKKCGWHILPEALEEMDSNESGDITRRLLHMDLRTIGSGWIPEGLRKYKSGKVDATGILQIMKVRNIAAPKINEESKTSPSFHRISATDGKESVTLLDMHHHPKLSIDTPPGTKLLLKNGLTMWDGYIVVRKDNTELLGGNVEKLVEAWKLRRDFSAMTGPQLRRMADGTGPPPFVPFGSKKAAAPSRQDRNFRAMDSVRDAGAGRADEDADEDATREFQEHRKAVIEEARQQGGKEARSKLQNFAQQRVKLPPGRGVDQMERREDIERMKAMGFKPREAAAALRKASGDVQKAIDALLSDQAKGIGMASEQRGGGRRGRKGHDPIDSDEDDYGSSSVRQAPPSGPATLLDFVAKKKSNKEGAHGEAAKAPDNTPKAGQMVMAQWRDGRKYRARVDEVFKPDGVVGVFFLDYGEHDVIPISHVTPIPNAQCSEPQPTRDFQSNRRQAYDAHPPESNQRFQKFDNRPRNQDRQPQQLQRHQTYGNRQQQQQHRPPQRDGGHQFFDGRSQEPQQQQRPSRDSGHQQFSDSRSRGPPQRQHQDSHQPQYHNPPPPHRFNQFSPHHVQHGYNDSTYSNEGQANGFYRQGTHQQHFDHRPQRQPQRGYSQGDYFEGYPAMQGRPQSVEDGGGQRSGFPLGSMQFTRGGQGRPFSARR